MYDKFLSNQSSGEAGDNAWDQTYARQQLAPLPACITRGRQARPHAPRLEKRAPEGKHNKAWCPRQASSSQSLPSTDFCGEILEMTSS